MGINSKKFFAVFFLLLCFCSGVHAGALSDFETDVKSGDREDESPARSDRRHHHDSDSEDSSSFSDFMAEIFMLPFKLGGYMSLARVDMPRVLWPEDEVIDTSSDTEFPVVKRLNGESLIPFARTDLFTHVGDQGVYSANGRTEFGYGPLGVEFRYTDLRERGSSDRIQYSVFNLLYRMSFGSRVEVDLGLGAVDFYGHTNTSGASFTTPVIYHHNHSMGVEWRPTWFGGEALSYRDHMLSFHYGRRYYSATLGYRWLSSENVSLAGPVMGLVLKW